jgi:hypothetical protein
MQRMGDNPDRHFSAGYEVSQNSDLTAEAEHLASDRQRWGEPLSYQALLSDPFVEARITRLIVKSALKRSRIRVWWEPECGGNRPD